MFLVFLGFSLKTGGGEPNWPVTAYLSGGVLAAGWLASQLQSRSELYRRSIVVAVALTGLIGLAVTVVMHHTEQIHPLLERLAGPPTAQHPFPARRFDPTCRLRGWRTLGHKIDQLCEELTAKGKPPVLAAYSWSVPGELGVYCAGHPQAYSVGLMQGDRHSQYDCWTNPIDHPDEFDGRTFLIVGGIGLRVGEAFDRIEGPLLVTHRENGRAVARWEIFICHGFHGFGEKPAAVHRARFGNPTTSLAHELLEDIHLQRLVIAFRAEALDKGVVDGANHLEQAQEQGPAVAEVFRLVGLLRRPHGLDVQPDRPIVAGPLQHPDGVEGPAQVHGAERLVLIVLQAVLIVEMNAPQLLVPQGVGHIVRGIEAGQDGMGRLDQNAANATGSTVR